MARIRSVKPEFFSDEKLAREHTRDERIFYEGLWLEADDEGRFLPNPRRLLGAIFPYEEDITEASVSGFMAALEKFGRVSVYEVEGSRYAWLPKFKEHQKISHPTPSRLPPPPGGPTPTRLRVSSGETPEPSGNPPEEIGSPPEPVEKLSPPRARTRDLELGKGKGSGDGSGKGSLDRPDVRDPAPASFPQQDVLSNALNSAQQRRLEAARSDFAHLVRYTYHLGRPEVGTGDYLETIEVALDRFDRWVGKHPLLDPVELVEQMALVRVVESFPEDEPITTSVYFSRDRAPVREQCRTAWLAQQPTFDAPSLPTVELRSVPKVGAR